MKLFVIVLVVFSILLVDVPTDANGLKETRGASFGPSEPQVLN